MATYIGYYRPNPGFLQQGDEQAREAGEQVVNPTMREKVIGLRDALPSSMRFIGSFNPMGRSDSRPGVWIVETDNPDDLLFVSTWYTGFLDFDWAPCTAVGTTSAETTAAMDAAASR